MGMSNKGSNVQPAGKVVEHVNLQQAMEDYDSLPPRVIRRLIECRFNLSPCFIRKALDSGQCDESMILSRIASTEASAIAQAEKEKQNGDYFKRRV